MEKSATEARAVMVFAKAVSSPSLKDRIINFSCGSPPSPNKYYANNTAGNPFSGIKNAKKVNAPKHNVANKSAIFPNSGV